MSRVYEAMRRAAPSGDAAVLQPEPEPEFVSEKLTAFPEEVLADRPQPAASASRVLDPAGAPPSALTPPPTEVVPVAPADAAKATPTFHRIATRYEGKTVLDADVSPQSREQYRRLAASLHRAQAMHGTKVVMITSALVGEGKTLTASNVALTLSQSYQKQVLLMDADLRRPSLQAVFGIGAESGLSEGLTAGHERAMPVHQVSSRLGILPAGRPTSDPIAALTSERMHRLIEEARQTFDWVILDTPPVALLTDANLVSAMTDGAIIVVKANSTPWDLVDHAVQAIGRDRTLGVVLNHAVMPSQGSGYYGYYYYSSSGEQK